MNETIPACYFPQKINHLLDERIYSLPLWKHALLAYLKMMKVVHLTLHVSPAFFYKIKEEMSHDRDFMDYQIDLVTTPPPDSAFSLSHIILYNGVHIEINQKDDIKNFRKKMKSFIRHDSPTFIAKNFNKRISLPLSQLLSYTHISPNSITTLALLSSLLGFYCLIHTSFYLWAFVFFQINSLLDGCDGEVARMKYQFSRFGKKYDIFGDYLTSVLVIFGEAFAYTKVGTLAIGPWLTFFNMICLLSIAFIWILALIKKWTPQNFEEVEGLCHKKLSHPKTWIDHIARAALFISRRDLYLLVLFLLGVTYQVEYVHGFISLVCACWLGLSLYTLNFIRTTEHNS